MGNISKLPIRQITADSNSSELPRVSKLPIRQITPAGASGDGSNFSKLPIRQITAIYDVKLERAYF